MNFLWRRHYWPCCYMSVQIFSYNFFIHMSNFNSQPLSLLYQITKIVGTIFSGMILLCLPLCHKSLQYVNIYFYYIIWTNKNICTMRNRFTSHTETIVNQIEIVVHLFLSIDINQIFIFINKTHIHFFYKWSIIMLSHSNNHRKHVIINTFISSNGLHFFCFCSTMKKKTPHWQFALKFYLTLFSYIYNFSVSYLFSCTVPIFIYDFHNFILFLYWFSFWIH